MPATLLCIYRYDPLDRLTHHAVATHTPIQRFYCKSRLATEIDGVINRSIVQHADQLLALTETQGNLRQATLLATDQQRSVLQAIACNESQSHAYSPYGNRTIGNGLLSLLGFNGERPDPVTGHYLLGNGYRAFNPVLMRFNSPDNLSPFGKGGLNPYAYCHGDPVNQSDPTGHAIVQFGSLLRAMIVLKRGARAFKAARAARAAAPSPAPVAQSSTAMLDAPSGPSSTISPLFRDEMARLHDGNQQIIDQLLATARSSVPLPQTRRNYSLQLATDDVDLEIYAQAIDANSMRQNWNSAQRQAALNGAERGWLTAERHLLATERNVLRAERHSRLVTRSRRIRAYGRPERG